LQSAQNEFNIATFSENQFCIRIFIFLPFTRTDSAVSSNAIGQMHCAFHQKDRPNAPYIHIRILPIWGAHDVPHLPQCIPIVPHDTQLIT